MSDTLKWRVRSELFEDGSQLSDWQKIEQSAWQWQYDTHELAFDIYEHMVTTGSCTGHAGSRRAPPNMSMISVVRPAA